MSIHDELVYEVKEEYADIMAAELKYTMESAVELTIPVLVDVGIGENYGESKI